MSVSSDWEDRVESAGGQLVGHDQVYNGVTYDFKSRWNTKDDADAFVEKYEDEIGRYAITYEETGLYLFFSVEGGRE